MSEWERVLRATSITSFSFHHTTRPLIRQSKSVVEAVRIFKDLETDFVAGPPSIKPFRLRKSRPKVEPKLPGPTEDRAVKTTMEPELTTAIASRLLNRFHDVIRSRSQGNLRLNEWTVHEQVTGDTITNSEGLRLHGQRRRTTIAFQLSSPTGLISRFIPLQGPRSGIPPGELERLCDELTVTPSPPPTLGRYPAILSPEVVAALVESLLPLLRSGFHFPFTLPKGWCLVDDPVNGAPFHSVPTDGQGRVTAPLVIWEGDRVSPITDTLTARRRSLPATGHAVRESITSQPVPNYHNLVLVGPQLNHDALMREWGSGLHLLRPLHVHFVEKNVRLQLIASGFTMEGDAIRSYHPHITCRFTLKDLFRNLEGTIGHPAFFLMDCVIGAPACYFGSINVYS